MREYPVGSGKVMQVITCKELDTINVRYIDTGGWEITKFDGTKEYYRSSRQAASQICRFFNESPKQAREWMRKAKVSPVSFDEFLPFYAEIVRLNNGKWQILAADKTWENVGTRARASSRLRFCTDLTPKERRRVLDYAERIAGA